MQYIHKTGHGLSGLKIRRLETHGFEEEIADSFVRRLSTVYLNLYSCFNNIYKIDF
jgi:hypothetical protein